MKTKSRNYKVVAMAMGLACMTSVVSAAPHNSLADSDFNTSALVSELEPERNVKPQKPSIDLKAERPQPMKTEATARINSVKYQCQELDVTPLVSHLEKGRTHKRWNFNDIQIFAMLVTQELRDLGYFMAVAYVPPQDFENKELTINVIIGRYGNVDISNTSMMTDKRLLGLAKKITPGKIIKKQAMERVLTTVNDVPGMILKADMAPGKKPGTADIYLDVKTLEKQGGYAYIDNYGSRSTGRWRLGANYHYNNVSRVGDQIEFNYLVGFKNDDDMKKGMSNYMLRYNVPYKNAGTMFRAGASHMNYGVGSKLVPGLDIKGEADSLEFGVTHPMHRTADHSHWIDLGFTYRDMEDEYTSAVVSNKDSRSAKVEFHGFTRSERDSVSYSVSTDWGDVNYKSQYALETNIYKTDGHFVKSNFSVFHVHQFDKRWSVQNGVYGQYAWNNLDSSEDFYVGGESGVRAFPQGEAGGNHGLLGTIEFRYRTGQPEISLAAFIDAARVWNYKDNYQLGSEYTENQRNLVGAGLGIHYLKSRKWMGKLEWATPIGNHYSNSKKKDIHSTWWFRLIRQF